MPLGHHLKTGYLKRGETLAELAAQAGIDAKGARGDRRRSSTRPRARRTRPRLRQGLARL